MSSMEVGIMQTTAEPTGVRALAGSVRAEVLRLRKWPAVWVLAGVWLALNLTFAYVFNYIAYATGSGNFAADPATAGLLADLLPEAIPGVYTGGLPMFGGAIMMILGALAAGSGFGWGAWKTVLTQGPGRLTAFGGTLLALGAVVVAILVGQLVLDFGASILIATVESQPLAWPDAAELVQSFGGGLLISAMWAAAGVLIGVLTKSPAIAVGLGLVWSLVVENLLRGVANLISGLEYVTDVLPGTAAGSMAGTLAASLESGESAPGVNTILSGSESALLLVGYLVVFLLAAAVTMRRRDFA